MSLLIEENNKQAISDDQDESFGKTTKKFLENKRTRRNHNYQLNNDENDINNNEIGTILNIPQFLSKINTNDNNTISLLNSDMILFILELCLNSSQFNLKGDNSSRKFWEEVGKITQLSPILNIFKPETLRKYWRLLRNIKKPKKIINVINEHKDILDNENIKLLSCINIIYDYNLFPKKGIDFFINKYCGKILNKAKKERSVKEMTIEEQIDELITEFEKAFPLKKKEEILEKLYQTSFDIKNTYLVLKDEANFGYLCFNENEDKMILDKELFSYKYSYKYKEFSKKKGHINIIKRRKFLEGNS